MKFEVKPIPLEDPRCCWNTVAGKSAIITGFPIARRQPHDIGLAASLEVMARLVGIPLAITYSGGYILKGRYHAFVPVHRNGNTVQWHIIDMWPKRLEFNDIQRLCPKRLLKSQLDAEALSNTEAIFGWCPVVNNSLGAYSAI